MGEFTFNITFIAESESHKREMEKGFDDIFHSTNFRRISTKEVLLKSQVIITFEDTRVRH